MRAERNLRGIWRAIVDDPYRKLVAVGLAVLMWFFINSRITKTIERTIPLVVVSPQEATTNQSFDRLAVMLPLDRVVVKRFLDGEQPITRVTVVLSGPRFRIDAIEDEPLNLIVNTLAIRDWSRPFGPGANSVELIEFSASDIRKDLRALQEVRIELQPTRVRLECEAIENRSFPITEEMVEFVGDLERLRLETAVYSPASVTILGPAIGIAELESRRGPLFRVELRVSGNERPVTAPLEIIRGSELGVRFERPPMLQVQLLPQTSDFSLTLPIVVDDLSLPPEERGKYVAESSQKDVRVRVAGNLRTQLLLLSENPESKKLLEWGMRNLRLQVYIPPPEPGEIYGQEMNRQAYLVPVGPLLAQVDRNEFVLPDPIVVKLRRQ